MYLAKSTFGSSVEQKDSHYVHSQRSGNVSTLVSNLSFSQVKSYQDSMYAVLLHSLFLLRQAIYCADMVVVMDKGEVKWFGTVTDMPKAIFPSLSSSNEFDMSSSKHLTNKRKESFSIKKDDVDEVSSEAADTVKVEERKEGRVEVAVYRLNNVSLTIVHFDCLCIK